MNLKVTVREGVDWVRLAHEENNWRDVVNEVMKIRIP
jgi:hypothetical protein